MNEELSERVLKAIHQAGGDTIPPTLGRDDSLVLRLGFDSMKLALLSLSLESEFGCEIALDVWIGAHPDPRQLTVGSLNDYVESAVRRSGST